MFKRRSKFDLLMEDLRRLLTSPSRDTAGDSLRAVIWQVNDFLDELARADAKTRQLLDFVSLLRASNAPGRQAAEEKVLDCLPCLADRVCAALGEAGVGRAPGLPLPHEVPAATQAPWQVLRELHDFAMSCFAFSRPRDSFGGKRRAHAFAILGSISRIADLPEAFRLAVAALGKSKSVEASLAAAFLQEYFEQRDDSPDDALVEKLLQLAEQTDSQSTAYRALDTLVTTGIISEFTALDRLDDWKMACLRR